MPGCDAASPASRIATPDTTAGDKAAVAVVAAPGPPAGRGFRFSGNQIIADTFVVHSRLRAGQLTLRLDTDLGDAAEVFVSVARSYREEGHPADYLIEYFNEAGTVGTWRAGRTIDLTATDFWAEVEKLRRAMALQGAPFTVGTVSDRLKVDFVVYPGQPPPFVRGNANLAGKAVSIVRGNRVIEKGISVPYPVPPAATAKHS